MKTIDKFPQFEESLRDYLSSPIPGLGIKIYELKGNEDFTMDPYRYDDLNYVTNLLYQGDDTFPPASFRADTVLLLSSVLGSRLGKNHLTYEELIEADRLVFRGGKTTWLGLEIDTRPVYDEVLKTNLGEEIIKSQRVAEYVAGTLGGEKGVNLLGAEITTGFIAEDTAAVKQTLAGRLILQLLKDKPLDSVHDSDLQLLVEHYEETGQILLGTNDQFINFGDSEKGSKAFWLLQIHEAEQQPISQMANADGSAIVKHYADGSKRTEIYDGNRVKIMFEAPQNIVSYGDRRAEDPIMTVVGGYEQFSNIPYIPMWMKESEIASLPMTAILDVYTDRYVIAVHN